MANCEFPITFHQSVEELVARFDEAITARGGQFSGDADQATFTIPTARGPVEGSYRTEDNTFHFILTAMPDGLTCHKADNTFRSLIGSPPDLSLDFL
ncbi:hypothetical protein GGR26_002245 [Lewinella marina]|uniref:Uncharacterized protein n=1 Tax=Neolewinella marina TaxID=438751 RepID=A0A2G0CGG2_9BACT|nr:hypothetical protein [Neolewinella marina]NJB86477.1 hypothetical protein [Neolewinella marina]PHK99063.1 hypothetical protein CGL56_06275 [Neolewinella marina]